MSNESESLGDKGRRMDKQLLLKRKFSEITPSRKENSVVGPQASSGEVRVELDPEVPPVSER